MRRHSTTKQLPSLQQSNKNSVSISDRQNANQFLNPNMNQNTLLNAEKGSNSKNSHIKEIEDKLSYHENEISRNQKTILTLTKQFKVLKDELLNEQELNKNNEKIHQRMVEETNRLVKRNKELKVMIGSLEVGLKEREKQLELEKMNWKRQSSRDMEN